jgi:hypothetical protein
MNASPPQPASATPSTPVQAATGPEAARPVPAPQDVSHEEHPADEPGYGHGV